MVRVETDVALEQGYADLIEDCLGGGVRGVRVVGGLNV